MVVKPGRVTKLILSPHSRPLAEKVWNLEKNPTSSVAASVEVWMAVVACAVASSADLEAAATVALDAMARTAAREATSEVAGGAAAAAAS